MFVGCSKPHALHILTVGDGLHAEAQQCMQEVHNVIQGVFVDILAHRLAELHPVQLVQAGQAVLGLRNGSVNVCTRLTSLPPGARRRFRG